MVTWPLPEVLQQRGTCYFWKEPTVLCNRANCKEVLLISYLNLPLSATSTLRSSLCHLGSKIAFHILEDSPYFPESSPLQANYPYRPFRRPLCDMDSKSSSLMLFFGHLSACQLGNSELNIRVLMWFDQDRGQMDYWSLIFRSHAF